MTRFIANLQKLGLKNEVMELWHGFPSIINTNDLNGLLIVLKSLAIEGKMIGSNK